MPVSLIHDLSDEVWHKLLRSCLLEADVFCLHVPDGDGPLSVGRHDAQALPDASTQSWSGMADSLEIRGPLSRAARNFFTVRETSLTSIDPERKLWDYRLLRSGEVLLSISDFTVLLVDTDKLELANIGVPACSISDA